MKLKYKLKIKVDNLKDIPLLVLEKLIVTQMVKKLPTFHENQMFITMFTGACHWTLS
jgi:hypothetical protein